MRAPDRYLVRMKLWQFVLLGVLLPVGSAAASLVLIHRLEGREGLGSTGGPPG